MVRDLFGAEAGEFFVHRNIANLIPPCTLDGRQHGTLGHHRICGDGAEGPASDRDGAFPVRRRRGLFRHAGGRWAGPEPGSFVGDWLQILAPSVPPLIRTAGTDAGLRALEHQGVLVSLANLMTFEFVSEAVNSGKLQLHGLWNDISDGELEVYNSETNSFYRI